MSVQISWRQLSHKTVRINPLYIPKQSCDRLLGFLRGRAKYSTNLLFMNDKASSPLNSIQIKGYKH